MLEGWNIGLLGGVGGWEVGGELGVWEYWDVILRYTGGLECWWRGGLGCVRALGCCSVGRKVDALLAGVCDC